MKVKVAKVKATKPTKKVGKAASGKVKTGTKAVGIPKMRTPKSV